MNRPDKPPAVLNNHGRAQGLQGYRFVKLTLVTMLLLALACLLANANWILNGKSIHNFCTLSAQPGFLLKHQIDRFKDFNFSPSYWTSQVLTGLPLYAGYGVENLLLVVGAFFKQFGNAVAFYDGLVQCLGCLGLYFLLLHFGFTWITSTICALLLGFNAYYPAYGTDPQLGVVIYFTPWVILAWDKYLFRTNDTLHRLWYGALLALCLGAFFVASTIQQYAFVVLVVMIPYGIAAFMGEVILPWRPGQGTIRLDPYSNAIGIILGWAALAFGVNLLLILFELWPTLQTIQLGNRVVDSWLSTLFLVAIVTTLAVPLICTVIASDRKVGRVLVIFLIVAVLLAQWGPLSQMFTSFFKGFEKTGFAIFNRSPNYVLTPVQAVLVAYGIFMAGRQTPAAVVLLSLGMVILLIGPHTPWFPFLHVELWNNQDDIGRLDFVSMVGLMVGLAAALDSLKTRLAGGKSRLLFGVILAVLLAESPFLYWTQNLFTEHFRFVQDESPEAAFLKTLPPATRVSWVYDEMHKNYMMGFLPKETLPQYLIITYFGPASFCVNGYAILPRTSFEYASKAMPTFFGLDPTQPANNLVDLAGVRYIFARKSLQVDTSNLKLIQSTRDYHIYENPRAFPHVFLVPRVERVPEKQLLQRLASEDLEKLKTVAYLTDAGDAPQAELPAGAPAAPPDLGTVHIVKYEDQLVEIKCRINQACFLILTDAYHPAWKVYVQGQPVPIYRADYLFRWVKLPPGNYILTFKFDPGVNRLLFLVSSATLIMVLLGLVALPLIILLRKT